MAEVIFNQSGGKLRIQDGGAYKVSHIGKQPTSLNRGLESVSQISMATQITPGFSQKCHATSKSTWLTLINRRLFWARKLTTELEGLGSVLSYFFPSDSSINLYTCKSNEEQLYFQKLLILYKRDLCPICKQRVCTTNWNTSSGNANLNSLISTIPLRKASFKRILNKQKTF